MPLTAEQFLARNSFFSERSPDDIEAAQAFAAVGISLDVCKSQMGDTNGVALYEQMHELRTVECLLAGFTGLPTSVTTESGLLNSVQTKLKQLYVLATPRCGVAGGCK
jgi:hypothetical protein